MHGGVKAGDSEQKVDPLASHRKAVADMSTLEDKAAYWHQKVRPDIERMHPHLMTPFTGNAAELPKEVQREMLERPYASETDWALAMSAFIGNPIGRDWFEGPAYADKTIPRKALEARRDAWGRIAVPGETLASTSIFVPGEDDPGHRHSSAHPLDDAVTAAAYGIGNPVLPPVIGLVANKYGGNRAFHIPLTGDNFVPPSNIHSMLHESGGHGMNPVLGYDRRDRRKGDGPLAPYYYLSSPPETSAFLGNLRRQVNKRQGLDIADPVVLQRVLKDAYDNPYNYRDYSSDVRSGLMQYHRLMGYDGADQDIVRRRDEIKKLFADRAYLNQHAQVPRKKPKGRAALA